MEINLKASNLPISPYAVLFMGLRDERFPTQLTTTDVIIKIVFLSFLKEEEKKALGLVTMPCTENILYKVQPSLQ